MDEQPLILVGGWGLHVAAVAAVAQHWPGPVAGVSLDDSLLGASADMDELVDRARQQVPYGSGAVWAGWSLGGQVAVAAAHRHPDAVNGVLTLCSTPCFTRKRDWKVGMPDSIFDSFISRFEADPERQWQRFLYMQIQGDDQERLARRAFRAWLQHGAGMSPETLFRGLQWLDSLDQRELWRTLPCPAAHIFGGRDPLVDERVPETAGLANERVHRIQGMAHWPFGAGLMAVQERFRPETLV